MTFQENKMTLFKFGIFGSWANISKVLKQFPNEVIDKNT